MPSSATFDKIYGELNDAQRRAVDVIDGPVLVVAGPGTGKTQLLSTRVANILRQTDFGPENILCLTFTDEAARNMSERLSKIIGRQAYDVPIMTFHSFGASIINQYGEYFFREVGTEQIDNVKEYTILEEIFKKLPSDNPLSMAWEDSYLYLDGGRQAISDFKQAGLSPDEVEAVARSNLAFVALANKELVTQMDGFTRIDKTSLDRFEKILEAFRHLRPPKERGIPLLGEPLQETVITKLTEAIDTARESGSTKALTKFKDAFLVNAGGWRLKDTDTSQKLLALAAIYQEYLLALRTQNLFDYNDMILRVAHAMELSEVLRFSLQERYQYILVDEFQDTSGAQLRLLRALVDNPVYEGRPNIMAVGDNRQAIYSFQGANTSQSEAFFDSFRQTTKITLDQNYRSHQRIIDLASFAVGDQPSKLKAVKAPGTGDGVDHQRFASQTQQFQWVAAKIRESIEAGTAPDQIAVIARKHRSLQALVPFLAQAHIPVAYERREDILQTPFVHEIMMMARLIMALSENDQDTADALLPEILSYGFWGLATQQIWQLYLENYRKQRPWLEIIRNNSDAKVAQIADFLLILALRSKNSSLETVFDYIIGAELIELNPKPNGQTTLAFADQAFISPFKDHYFGSGALRDQPLEYLELLSHLNFLRENLRRFNERGTYQTLASLLEYVTLCEHAGIRLVDTTPHRERTNAVHLNSAHGVKGLEFDEVFIIDADQDKWSGAQPHRGRISMPANLHIERSANDEDEDRRLLYVAMTRAAHRLTITGYDSQKRGSGPLKFLMADIHGEIPDELVPQVHAADESSNEDLLNQMTAVWQDRHTASPLKPELADLLKPALENYRLSVTHLNTFLDIERDGAKQFLLNNLLHFPQATKPALAFGNAVHATLDEAQKFLKAEGKQKSIEALIGDFERLLSHCRLDMATETQLTERGRRVLTQYFEERYDGFRPEEYFEFNLANRQLVLDGEVRLTGKIDRITPLGGNDYRLTDFKTGRPKLDWKGGSAVQLYSYKRQLAFYRLLLEESGAFGSDNRVHETAIEYVEPDPQGRLVEPLRYSPTDEEIDRLKLLIRSVWRRIMSLNFPDTSHYINPSLKDQIAFEEALIKEVS